MSAPDLQPLPCMAMVRPTNKANEDDFLPLERGTNENTWIITRPFAVPTKVTSQGTMRPCRTEVAGRPNHKLDMLFLMGPAKGAGTDGTQDTG